MMLSRGVCTSRGVGSSITTAQSPRTLVCVSAAAKKGGPAPPGDGGRPQSSSRRRRSTSSKAPREAAPAAADADSAKRTTLMSPGTPVVAAAAGSGGSSSSTPPPSWRSAAERGAASSGEGIGAAAKAADGVAAALSGSSSSNGSSGNGSSNGSSRTSASASSASTSSADASMDTVNVRVPASFAWANPETTRSGRARDVSLTQDLDEDEVDELKVKLLAAVASLDRGLAANARESADVDALARQLEEAAGPVALKWTTSRSSPDASTTDKLAGTWRLIYSSGFNGGNLGGGRPGPPAPALPGLRLGQVYQVIDLQRGVLDNVVELLALGLPSFVSALFAGGGGGGSGSAAAATPSTPGLRLTLRHTCAVREPRSVEITYEETFARAVGGGLLAQLPELAAPNLLPDPVRDATRALRSATFDVTYLDAGMRVTRGDRSELRVYLKDKDLDAAPPADYVD